MGEGIVNNKLEIKAYLDKKDLELYYKVLFEQNFTLQLENERLKEKVQHLEELLVNMDSVPTIGGKK